MAFGITCIQAGIVLADGSSSHPAPITVDAGVLIYFSFTGPAGSLLWTWTAPAGDPQSVLSSATSAEPTAVTHLDGEAYSLRLEDQDHNIYVLDIVTPTAAIAPAGAGVISSVTTIASLRLQTNGAAISSLLVRCYQTLGDQGGGVFAWNATSTTADDSGTIIQATGVTTGRWERVYSGARYFEWFGAKADAVNMTGRTFTALATSFTQVGLSSANIGQTVVLNGANTAGKQLLTTITDVIGTTVSIGATIQTTVSGTGTGFYCSDDAAAVQAAVDSLGSTSGMRGGEIYGTPGRLYNIGSTILLDHKTARLFGGGVGSSLYGGAALRWIGNNSTSMLKMQACWKCHISQWRFIGCNDPNHIPTAAIEMKGISGQPAVTDIFLDHIWIGGMSTQDTPIAGGFSNGIITSGDDVQCDQSSMHHIQIQDVVTDGIYFSGGQNVAWDLQHITINSCTYGIHVRSRQVLVNNVTLTSISGACFYVGGDGNLRVRCAEVEGASMLMNTQVGGGTGAFGFDIEHLRFQMYQTLPSDGVFLNFDSQNGDAYLRIGGQVAFTRDSVGPAWNGGVWSPGLEKIKIRNSKARVHISDGVLFGDGSTDAIVASHLNFNETALGGAEFRSVHWGNDNYNYNANGYGEPISARHDFIANPLFDVGVVLQQKLTLGGTTKVPLITYNIATGRVEVANATYPVGMANDLVQTTTGDLVAWRDLAGIRDVYNISGKLSFAEAASDPLITIAQRTADAGVKILHRKAGAAKASGATGTNRDSGDIKDELVAPAAGGACGKYYVTTPNGEGIRVSDSGSAATLSFYGGTPQARVTYTAPANHTDDRALDETGDTLPQVANVLGTLIKDLRAMGLLG